MFEVPRYGQVTDDDPDEGERAAAQDVHREKLKAGGLGKVVRLFRCDGMAWHAAHSCPGRDQLVSTARRCASRPTSCLPSERSSTRSSRSSTAGGKPLAIHCDNGLEYLSAAMIEWAAQRGIRLDYIQQDLYKRVRAALLPNLGRQQPLRAA